jgi:putative ABC transport system permease protein
MFGATIRSLLSHKLRLLLSAFAVVLGVMSVSSALVLTDTLSRSYKAMFSTAFDNVDVEVSAPPKVDTGYYSVPSTIPASMVDRLRRVPGAAQAIGSVGTVDGARVIGKDGKVLSTFGAPRFGVNWTGEDEYVKLRAGRGPQSDGEIAINGGLAKVTGYGVGDRIDVLTLQSRQTFTVVGVFGYFGNRDSLAGETMVAFTTPAAQRLLLGAPNEFTAINVRRASGVTQQQLRDRIAADLGTGYRVQTGQELAAQSSQQLDAGLKFFSYILLGFASVALFVGVFLILNTFSIIVAQRMRELALMRAMGASRRQVVVSVETEAAVVGVLSSVVGFGLGVGVGRLLAWLYATFLGGGVALAPLRVPLSSVVGSFAVGILVTMLAALLPALRAARIPPVAAMREAAAGDRPLTRTTVTGAAITLAGGGLLWAGLTDHAGQGNSLLALLVGLLLILTGVALLTPSLTRPVVSALAAVFAGWTPGRLGGRNSARNPRRTAVTAAALMVGVSLITGISVVLTSATASLNHILDTQMHVDLIIAGDQTVANTFPPTFDGAVLDRARVLPGVAGVVGVYSDVAMINGRPTPIAAVSDSSQMRAMAGMTAREGTLDGLGAGQLIVDENTAKSLNLHAGDSVRVQLSKGAASVFTITGVYSKATGVNGWITGQTEAVSFRTNRPSQGFIETAPGASIAQIKAELATLLADNPEVSVTDRSGYVQQQTRSLDSVMVMVQMLLALSIIIALLGIVNTLALSIIERTRELGLLRAIGLRRRQLMSMVGVESVVISVFGALLGVAVGVAMGAATTQGLRDQGFTTIGVPWAQIVVYLALGAVVGVIASVVPAIRAARLNVLNAIAYE